MKRLHFSIFACSALATAACANQRPADEPDSSDVIAATDVPNTTAPATPPIEERTVPASDSTAKDPATSPAASSPASPERDGDPTSASADDDARERAASDKALTPLDQGENTDDLRITQRIRKAVMADDSLSFDAKNVKIITSKGKVTLRGMVENARERAAVVAAAQRVAGAGAVTSQLEIDK